MSPDLSIVLPCYNVARFIPGMLAELAAYLNGLDITYEIVTVNDGSTDDTAHVLTALDLPALRMVTLPANRGKGGALIAGMGRAAGRYRIFTDADLPYDLSAIPAALDRLDAGSPAVFGNRHLIESEQAVETSLLRRAGHSAFGLAAGLVIGQFGHDTQCGFKGFSGSLATTLFPQITLERFGFDVEIYMLLIKAGIPISTVPVRLVRHDVSTVNMGSGAHAFIEISRLARPGITRRYDLDALRQALMLSSS